MRMMMAIAIWWWWWPSSTSSALSHWYSFSVSKVSWCWPRCCCLPDAVFFSSILWLQLQVQSSQRPVTLMVRLCVSQADKEKWGKEVIKYRIVWNVCFWLSFWLCLCVFTGNRLINRLAKSPALETKLQKTQQAHQLTRGHIFAWHWLDGGLLLLLRHLHLARNSAE